MPAKKKSASRKISKTDFIRSFGPDASADDVVAKAKEQGLTLTKKYVWTKQSEMRKGGKGATKTAPAAGPKAPKRRGRKARKAKKAARSPQAAPKSAAPAKRVGQKSDDTEVSQQLRAAILNLGLARADALYQKVRTEAEAFIRG